MSKRIFAAILAAMLSVAALSGCGDKGNNSSTPGGNSSTGGNSSNTGSSGGSSQAEPYTPTYPIVSEPVTFTAATNFENAPKSIWYNAYAEATNVNIEWSYWSDWATQLGVAMAGDSLPDVTFALYMSGTDKAAVEEYGKAGSLVEYGQYLNIMPNVSSLFEQYPESRVACANEDGTLYGFPAYLDTLTACAGTIYYRTDMFKEAGVSEPKTTDELLAAVKTLQSHFGAKDSEFVAMLPYSFGHVTGQLRYFLFPSFGDAVDLGYTSIDGKTVIDTRVSDQYRHTVEYMHELYASGGFDENCFSEDGTNAKAKILANQCAITTFGTTYSMDNFESGNYDVDMLEPLISQYSSTKKYAKAYNSRMSGTFISTKCKDVETMIKWLDSLYAPVDKPVAPGLSSISMWLGIRGENWEFDDDTNTTFSIMVPDDYDGAGTNWLSEFGCSNAFNCIFTGINNGSPGQICKGTGTRDKLLPYAVQVFPAAYFTFTGDESTRMSELGTDITTYFNQKFSEFMMNGVTDAAWSEYVSQMEKMGLEETIKIYQTAYDRYLNS